MHISRLLLHLGWKSICPILVASQLPARTANVTASTPPQHSSLHTRPSKNADLGRIAITLIVPSNTLPSHYAPSVLPAQTKIANSRTCKPSASSTLAQTPDVHISMNLVRTGICQHSHGRRIKPMHQTSRPRKQESKIKVMLVTENLSPRTKKSSSNQTRDKAIQATQHNKRRYLLEVDKVDEGKMVGGICTCILDKKTIWSPG